MVRLCTRDTITITDECMDTSNTCRTATIWVDMKGMTIRVHSHIVLVVVQAAEFLDSPADLEQNVGNMTGSERYTQQKYEREVCVALLFTFLPVPRLYFLMRGRS